MPRRETRRIAVLLTALLLIAGCSKVKDVPGLGWLDDKPKYVPPKDEQRIPVFVGSSALEADPALANTPVALPTPSPSDIWRQVGSNPLNNAGNIAGPSSSGLRTVTADAGDGEGWEYATATQPVVGEDQVFALDAKGYVSAHDKHRLTRRWQVLLSKNEPEEPLPGGGLALAGDTLYAASGGGMLVALSAADGSTKWKRSIYLPIRSAPKLADGRIYILTADNRLQAYAQEDGKLVWEHRAIVDAAGGLHAPSIAAAGPGVVAPFASGEIYTLRSANGREVWRSQVTTARKTDVSASLNHFVSEPFLAQGRIFIGSHSGAISALDFRSGIAIWQIETPGLLGLWSAGNYLFALMSDHRIAAIRQEDGRAAWVQNLTRLVKDYKDEGGWTGPLVINDRVWLFGRKGMLIQLDAADGSLVMAEDILPDGIVSLPAVTEGGLWGVTRKATLFKLY